jgi:2,3-bisphosphoglycerate-independent phosphoglycerate mutase
MSKVILFLADGMGDEPLEELDGKTPLEAVDTPAMDSIAEKGASGTFLSLPDGFPTSSDVANMSVMGYDLPTCYPGRGPLEAVSQDLKLEADDFAWRCNLVTVNSDTLLDYSCGQLDKDIALQLINDLQKEFGSSKVSFHPGVSYRNLLVLHGDEFSDKILYQKPDSSQGMPLNHLQLTPLEYDDEKAVHTVNFLIDLQEKTSEFLNNHPLNANLAKPANMIWPWSPGKKPCLPKFSEKYNGMKGAVITAVDVIAGIAKCAEMDVLNVEGATGFIDTNYNGKAEMAIKNIDKYDFIYLHVEAIDECSHMGDLKLKMQAIKDFDSKIVAPVLEAMKDRDVTFAVLPDHPVPIKLQKHTRTPVPVAVCGPAIQPDTIKNYSEATAPDGKLGFMHGDELIKLLLGI